MEALLTSLFASDEFKYVVALLATHLLASITNAIVPNEDDDAGPIRKLIGKGLRALSLTIGKATAKKSG